MTRNPDSLQQLEALFESQICDCWKGTVGDQYHFNGYHLGGFEVPYNDYSIVHPRDAAGIKQFGGYWAAAIDPGMDWPASRDWFMWLVTQCRAGKFPDIAEVIGSADGIQDYRYTAGDGFVYAELWHRNHIGHSHISFFRDSIFRSHTYLFDTWTRTGRMTKVGPKPTPGVSARVDLTPGTAVSPAPQVGGSSSTPLRGALLTCAFGVAAWVVRRRMELAREDSQ